MDILEFCGFTHGRVFWHAPDEEDGADLHTEPDLDMNFFFKYVEHKLWDYIFTKIPEPHVTLVMENKEKPYLFETSYNPDPNKAWQEALLKLIKE